MKLLCEPKHRMQQPVKWVEQKWFSSSSPVVPSSWEKDCSQCSTHREPTPWEREFGMWGWNPPLLPLTGLSGTRWHSHLQLCGNDRDNVTEISSNLKKYHFCFLPGPTLNSPYHGYSFAILITAISQVSRWPKVNLLDWCLCNQDCEN